jgi:hypothetical protein
MHPMQQLSERIIWTVFRLKAMQQNVKEPAMCPQHLAKSQVKLAEFDFGLTWTSSRIHNLMVRKVKSGTYKR